MGNQSADPQIYECAVGVLQAPWMVRPSESSPSDGRCTSLQSLLNQ
jgi:hypothetical protein